jgi:hypothetical protein
MWAVEEFRSGLTDFHGRNRNSLIRAAAQVLQQAGHSFSRVLGNTFRQAVAGIFSKQVMNTEKMLAGHVQATLVRCASSSAERILVAQDTTYYNYTTHKAIKGLGAIQDKIKGCLQHNVLALDETGLPLGLLHQQNWTRGGQQLAEKESQKWFAGLAAVNQQAAALGKAVMLMQDREADIFDFFKAPRADRVDLLVRVHQPRKVEVAALNQVFSLQQAAEQLAQQGELQVEVQRNNHPVMLQLQVRAGQVAILPDKDLSAQKHKATNLYLVVAREINAFDEQGESVFEPQQAACWLLLTSFQIKQAADALQVVKWYALRWRIERLHLVLKSAGLQVERLQFDDVHTLLNALAFYSIIAWRILYLTYLVRQHPELPPEHCFEQQELKLLEAKAKKPLQDLQQAMIALGKLVNFSPTKKQPLPGVKVLAQALLKLNHMVEAINLWRDFSLQD